jgi:hypothetical protein
MPAELKKFILERCYDYGALYSLEPEFNKIGLSIQATCGGDMILCKLLHGEPVAESLGTDHLFVGTQSRLRDEMPHKLIKCVLEFIDEASGAPSVPQCAGRPPRNGHSGFYGHTPGVGPIVQDMALSEADINSRLIDVLQKCCEILDDKQS